jgi:hypothetical protein
VLQTCPPHWATAPPHATRALPCLYSTPHRAFPAELRLHPCRPGPALSRSIAQPHSI